MGVRVGSQFGTVRKRAMISRAERLRVRRRRRALLERLESRQMLSADYIAEPNESLNDAYQIGTLWGQLQWSGSISPTGDEDWFSFELNQAPSSSHQITLDFDHDFGDLDMRLLDSIGTQIDSSTGTSDQELISLEGLNPGLYHLQIYGFSGAQGGYDLQIQSPAEYMEVDELEFNDSLDAATDLTWVRGEFEQNNLNLDFSGDQDHFQFTLASPGTSEHYLGAVNFDYQGLTTLELFDSNRNLITQTTEVQSHYHSLNDLPAGDYYLSFYSSGSSTSDYSLALILPEAGAPGDVFEPNDTRQEAYPLGLISGQYSTSLSIHETQDDDWIQFEIAEGAVTGHDVVIDFQHSAGDIDMSLYDATGTYLSGSAGVTNQELVSLAGRPAGTYFLQVYGWSGATNPSYALTINAPEAGIIADRFEDNDTQQTAWWLGDLSGAQEWTGLTIDAENDDDWFQFQILADGTESDEIQIDFQHAFGDVDMSLHDSAGTSLRTSGSVTDQETISLGGLAAGAYLLRVYGWGDATSPDYTLTIQAPQPEISADDYEQNDSIEAASDLGLIDGYWGAGLTLDTSEDSDWFRFRISETASEWHQVSASFSHELGDIDLELYDGDGNYIDGSFGVEDYETISLAGLPAGEYVVHAYGWAGATSPDYYLDLWVPQAGGTPDLYEVNDDAELATDFREVQGSFSASQLSIHNEDDRDWFRFETTGTGNPEHYVQIDFSHAAGDVDMALYDANLNPLDYSTSVSDQEVVSLDGLPSGVYYVEVYGYAEDINPAYDLRIEAPVLTMNPDGLESNNTLETATDLRQLTGVFEQTLSIHQSGDQDWFRFELLGEGGPNDMIEMNFAHAEGDLDMILRDASGDWIDSATGALDYESIPLEGLGRGVYYLEIYGFAGATNPAYDLRIEVEGQQDGPDRFEANDTLETATDLRTLTASVVREELSIHTSGDEDWFRFETTGTGSAESFLQLAFSHRLGDVDMRLRDAAGQILETSQSTADEEWISMEGLPAGVYFLQVYGYAGALNPNYALTIGSANASVLADRLEGNDSFNAASNVRNSGDNLAGSLRFDDLTLHTSTDVDYFRFTTVATGVSGNHVSIVGAGLSSGASIDLYDAQQSLVSSGSSQVSLNSLPAGTYFARVSSTSGALTRYSLSVDAPTATSQLDPWTVLVYITASDLEQFAFEDVNEIERALVDLPPNVNVAVYWDQSSARNTYATGGGSQPAWGTAGYAMISPDSNMNSIATTFEIVAETNTGNPATLSEFIRWGTTTAPAENYALVMWDHGAGIYGANYDDSDGLGRDNLTMAEIRSALQADDVPYMDVISFDACLMAMTEVAYELRDLTDFLVSSQEVVGAAGHDYRTLFDVLQNNPANVAAEQLAAGFVASYEQQYGSTTNGWDTQSALRMSELPDLLQSLASFTAAGLSATGQSLDALRTGLDAAISFYDPEFRDLGAFMQSIINDGRVTSTLRQAAQSVVSAVEDMVVSISDDIRNSSGISIYVPDRGDTSSFYRSAFAALDDMIDWTPFMSLLGSRAAEGGRLGRARSIQDWAESNNAAGLAFNLHGLAGQDIQFDDLSLHNGTDVDWYRFTMEAGAVGSQVSLQAVGTGTLSLQVYDATGVTVLGQTSGSENLNVDLSTLATGTYLVRVAGDGLAGAVDYQLAFDVPVAAGADDWAGSNDSLAKAYPLGLLTTQTQLSGLRVNSGAEDWFQMETPRFAESAHYALFVEPQGDEVLTVQVQDADGNIVSQATGSGRLLVGYEASGAAEQYFVRVINPAGGDQVTYQTRIQRATEAVYGLNVAESVSGTAAGELDLSTIYATVGEVTISDDRFELVDGELRLRPEVHLSESDAQQIWMEVSVSDGGGSGGSTTLTVPVRVNENPLPWRNSVLAWDVNNDGEVRPQDALIIINYLNRGGSTELGVRNGAAGVRETLYDVSGDNRALPIDALAVINYLNRNRAGEGESRGPNGAAFGGVMATDSDRDDRVTQATAVDAYMLELATRGSLDDDRDDDRRFLLH